MASKLDAPKWIEEGKNYIPKAEAELAAGNYGKAAYYANVAADTFIKGICLLVTGNELTGHSVVANCRQTSHFHKKLMMVLPNCAQLETYWVEDGKEPKEVSEAVAKQAIDHAKKVFTAE